MTHATITKTLVLNKKSRVNVLHYLERRNYICSRDQTSERKKNHFKILDNRQIIADPNLPVDVSTLSTFTTYFPRSLVPDFAQLRRSRFNVSVDGTSGPFNFLRESQSPKVGTYLNA